MVLEDVNASDLTVTGLAEVAAVAALRKDDAVVADAAVVAAAAAEGDTADVCVELDPLEREFSKVAVAPLVGSLNSQAAVSITIELIPIIVLKFILSPSLFVLRYQLSQKKFISQ